MFVKVCGVTNVEDGVFAHEMGAEIIGVVLASESPRKGTKETIKKISAEGIKTAAVYTDIESAMDGSFCEDYAQLHFESDVEMVQRIRDTGRKVISVIDLSTGIDKEKIAKSAKNADLVLLEDKRGIADILNPGTVTMNKNMGLAGRIGVDNIHNVLRLKPGFIDLSSSLELYPGKKDKSRIRAFFKEANAN